MSLVSALSAARQASLRPRTIQSLLFAKSALVLTSSFPLSRISARAMSQEYKLKSVTSLDLKPGDKQEVEVEGIPDAKVLLVNAGGKVQAIGPKCTHYGAPLVKGVLTTEGRLTCPWHGACFNAKTGDVEDAPALDSLPTFKVVERDGAVYVTGEEATIKGGRRKPKFQCASIKQDLDKVLVVGGGSGAIGLVEELREQGYQGPITVVSKEGYLPIDRPKLSKALLTDLSKLQWRDLEWLRSGNVEFVEDEVTAIDFSGKNASTKNGQTLPYGKLVLATGGTPRTLPLPGFKVLGNVFTLRTVHDVRKIVDAIGPKGKKIVVIGSSFIGMEVANATSKENTVTVVGMEKVPLERVLGEKIGAAAQKGLEANGAKFYMSAGVEKAEPSASDPAMVGSVILKDGTSLSADLVILGVGVAPATEFLKGNAGVQLLQDGSLEVDELFAVKGVKDVYALGDIATFPYHGPAAGGKGVRIEHWNVAQKSGRTAARHIVNPSLKAEFFTPIFWSALSAQVRYCGNTMASGWDDLVIQGNVDEGKWSAFYAKGEDIVAVATMGTDPVMVQSAELLRLGKMPKKSQLEKGFDVMSLGAPE
ncbi:putidaredoxin reductase [Gaeumannomyces tritici R3-111a-1]|uniref:Putidaredoxin reductase n=1 Tax=Gaeumannomyces tritici (strain R3-111a-1) TaxID=644352 RepID=J3P8H4_GAET3|nr:putidaredoxin reductase [Gaeumannomyces tritici R3-111a-1]EJT72957.1 putidaredoxin reductase [Gaeumannomyces tritici R3-111a-1]